MKPTYFNQNVVFTHLEVFVYTAFSSMAGLGERQVQILLNKWIGSSALGSALIMSHNPNQLMLWIQRHSSTVLHEQIHKVGDPKKIY